MEVRQRPHSLRERDVARLGQVVRERVPRHVRRLNPRPDGQERERGESKPCRLERRWRVAARKSHGVPYEAAQGRKPASPQADDNCGKREDAAPSEDTRLAEQEHGDSGGREAGGERGREVAARGVCAPQDAIHRVAGDEGDEEDRRGRQRRSEVAGERDHRGRRRGECCGRRARALPEPRPDRQKHGERPRRRHGHSGGGVPRQELVGIGASERRGAGEQKSRRREHQGRPEPPAPTIL